MCASETAILFGLAPETWGSPFALYANKVAGVSAFNPATAELMRIGHLMEPVIASLYEAAHGVGLEDPGRYALYAAGDPPWLLATPDRLVNDPERGLGVVELKNVSEWKADEWEDEPPLLYQVQVQHQLRVLRAHGVTWGAIAALIGGNRFISFPIVPHEAMMRAIVDRCGAFWDSVARREPPAVDATEATARVLAALYPREEPETSVPLPDEATEWHRLRTAAAEEIKRQQDIKDLMTHRLEAAIGAAAYGVLPDGTRYAYKTKKEYVVPSYQVKARRELRKMK